MNFWDRKKVLVTGGGGFIGSHVVERLLRHHKEVRVTVAGRMSKENKRNLSEVLRNPYLRTIKGDLRDPRFCRRACKGQDVVLNLAGVVGGVGNLNDSVPFTSCDFTRSSCEQRGMFSKDSANQTTQRFSGIEYPHRKMEE